MRIWHKELISVLPDRQLLGQWRELCAIAKNIKTKGTPNHLLVNRVTQFPPEHLYTYASIIMNEMIDRGFNCDWMAFAQHLDNQFLPFVDFDNLFNTDKIHWHTPRYFWQCYYNLEEKWDCGGIRPMEWVAIHNLIVSFRKG